MILYEKLKIYFFNIKIQILKLLEFKFDFVLSITLTGVNVLFYAFLWTSAYGGNKSIQDVTWGQMIVYSVTSNFMTTVFLINVQGYINESVKSGNIAYLLSKPLNICAYWLSNDIGYLVNQLIIHTVPIIGLIIFVFTAGIEIHLINVLLFLLSAVFSYLILWTISFCVGCIAFWYNELGTIGSFKDLIILLLSGSFVPLWFFPSIIQKISEFLPFQYIYQAALGILVNKYRGYEVIKILSIQIVWITLFILIASIVYNKAKHKLIVQGG